MSFLSFSLGGKRNKAAKNKCNSSQPKPLFLCHPYVTHMLVKGNFKAIVELPKYVDTNEWLAFNSKGMRRRRMQVLMANCGSI
ncbi:Maintenance of ploidy protein mob2 [Apophysomyces sp. BC1015]|nr:Maintenance of ploidy protein mob2 [Apophysomyces sp. BC1015]